MTKRTFVVLHIKG